MKLLQTMAMPISFLIEISKNNSAIWNESWSVCESVDVSFVVAPLWGQKDEKLRNEQKESAPLECVSLNLQVLLGQS